VAKKGTHVHLRWTFVPPPDKALGTTAKYPRHTTGTAAGTGLGPALIYLRGTAGNGWAQR
jgi:hypothetical protein